MKSDYSGLLDTMEWGYFVTLTSKDSINNNTARNRMNYLCRVIKAPAASKVFWITEKYKKGDVHIHSLIKTDVKGEIIKQWWEKKFGRCTVEPFDKSRRGCDYVTKYIEQKYSEYDFII